MRLNITPAKSESVYNFLCIGIAGSLIFWPLLCSILIICLSAYWLFFVKKEFNGTDRKSQFVILFAALYLPVVLGTFYSTDMQEAFAQLRIKLPFLAMPVVFGCTNIINNRIYNNIFRAFIVFTFIGCIICIAAGIMHYLQTGSAEQLHGHPLIILKDTPPFVFAFFCLLSAAYILNEFYSDGFNKPTYRAISIVFFLTFALFIFLLGNRNILSSLLIIMVVFGFLLIKKVIQRLLIFLLLISGVIAAIIFNPSLNRQWKDMTDFSASNTITLDQNKSLGRGWGGKAIRAAIWQCSADVIKEKWLTGVGTGDVQQTLQDAYEQRKFYFASRYNRYNAHDQYIQEILAFGIAGLLIFLACLIIPLITFIRSQQHRLYILFLICFMIICITDSILEVSKGAILYAFFNSLFVFSRSPNKKTPDRLPEG